MIANKIKPNIIAQDDMKAVGIWSEDSNETYQNQ
jgi:hypothetical protein